jgi:hypothetical protein
MKADPWVADSWQHGARADDGDAHRRTSSHGDALLIAPTLLGSLGCSGSLAAGSAVRTVGSHSAAKGLKLAVSRPLRVLSGPCQPAQGESSQDHSHPDQDAE